MNVPGSRDTEECFIKNLRGAPVCLNDLSYDPVLNVIAIAVCDLEGRGACGLHACLSDVEEEGLARGGMLDTGRLLVLHKHLAVPPRPDVCEAQVPPILRISCALI